MSNKDLNNLTKLGRQAGPSKEMEAVANPAPDRFYLIKMETSEFTCLCPVTGQPDFADIEVYYIPDQTIVESKSFKLYLWSYRNEGIFHEAVVNKIMDDLVKLLDPHWIKVVGHFNVRGGIGFSIEATHTKTEAAKSALENQLI
ncbi:MAG: preQ(1) synthase [Calditrichia bacterium]